MSMEKRKKGMMMTDEEKKIAINPSSSISGEGKEKKIVFKEIKEKEEPEQGGGGGLRIEHKLSAESLKLLHQLSCIDEASDKADLLHKKMKEKGKDEGKEKEKASTVVFEKAELIKQYEGLTTREEFMYAILSNYEKEKDINCLKNQLFGIMVSMLHLDHIASHPDEEPLENRFPHPDDRLPKAIGDNEFLAAATYYKPQHCLRGTEKEIDNFVRRNILKDDFTRGRFLKCAFYIVWDHMRRKEKEITAAAAAKTTTTTK